MAGGYPLLINRVRILTSEALYQACRFPHLPDVQKLIIGQASPMTAKMKSKPYRKDSRPDWDEQRVNIMRWCLRVKLAQHWDKFGELLLSTEDRPIVEESYRDQYWGAKPLDRQTLLGENVLGKLLVELREQLKKQDKSTLQNVESLPIKNFLLLHKPIGLITSTISSHKQLPAPIHLETASPISNILPATPNSTLSNTLSSNPPVQQPLW